MRNIDEQMVIALEAMHVANIDLAASTLKHVRDAMVSEQIVPNVADVISEYVRRKNKKDAPSPKKEALAQIPKSADAFEIYSSMSGAALAAEDIHNAVVAAFLEVFNEMPNGAAVGHVAHRAAGALKRIVSPVMTRHDRYGTGDTEPPINVRWALASAFRVQWDWSKFDEAQFKESLADIWWG